MSEKWSPCPGLNRRPRPYQGRALPTELHGPAGLPSLLSLPGGWSGKRDSNPRPPAWKAGALPLSYSRERRRHRHRSPCELVSRVPKPHTLSSRVPKPRTLSSRESEPRAPRSGHPRRYPCKRGPLQWWGGEDLNPRRRTPADLQSAPFGHLGTSPNLPARDESFLVAKRSSTLALAGGIEPPTHCLQGSCSAPELRQHRQSSKLFVHHP